jgi:hypothetical protein
MAWRSFVARIANCFEGPYKVLSIESRSPAVIKSHGLFNFRDRRKDVDREKIGWGAFWSIWINESSFRVEFENKEDGMSGDTRDVLLEFEAKLRERGMCF